MEITLEQLLKGKSTRINDKDFLSTEEYTSPFVDKMKNFTDSYRIEAISPNQITLDKEGEDITYNRVLIHAILPNKVDKYNEMYALTYSLDIRKPVYKVYRALYDNQSNILVAFNPNWFLTKEIKTNETFELPLTSLMEATSDYEVKLKKYNNTVFSTKETDRYYRLGSWIEKCQFEIWRNEFGGKVKWSPANVVKAYNNLYINIDSEYYVGDKDSTIMNTYNSFAKLIADDKKDICNKFEKTMLINSLLNLK